MLFLLLESPNTPIVSRVPTTGTFDKYLPLVVICHVVGTMLYIYTNVAQLPISHRLLVKVTQVKAVAHVCLPIRSRLVCAFPRLAYIGQADK